MLDELNITSVLWMIIIIFLKSLRMSDFLGQCLEKARIVSEFTEKRCLPMIQDLRWMFWMAVPVSFRPVCRPNATDGRTFKSFRSAPWCSPEKRGQPFGASWFCTGRTVVLNFWRLLAGENQRKTLGNNGFGYDPVFFLRSMAWRQHNYLRRLKTG